jgi:hypothetical protein
VRGLGHGGSRHDGLELLPGTQPLDHRCTT